MQVVKKIVHPAACLLLMIGISMHLPAQSPIEKKDEVRAVFLFNFARFIAWPETAFSSGTSPFVIGIIGKDPFGQYLDATIAGEKVNTHPLVIRRYKNIDEIGDCHILYMDISDTKKNAQALEKIKGRNTLSVSEPSDFLKEGGMVRFLTKDNKVQIQLNLDAAQAASLTVSSRLLRLVEIFDPGKK